jgi:hypothetical protein
MRASALAVVALLAVAVAGQNTCQPGDGCTRALCAVMRCAAGNTCCCGWWRRRGVCLRRICGCHPPSRARSIDPRKARTAAPPPPPHPHPPPHPAPAGTRCTEFCNNCTATCAPDASTLPSPTCPPDKPLVNCFASPCSLPNACPAGHTCTDDYCGGCNAICKPPRGCPCAALPCSWSPGGGVANRPARLPPSTSQLAAARAPAALQCPSADSSCTPPANLRLPADPHPLVRPAAMPCPNGSPPATCGDDMPDACAAMLCMVGTTCAADACNECAATCKPICKSGSIYNLDKRACERCAPGQMSTEMNSCVPCARGRASAVASNWCKACDANTYAPRVSAGGGGGGGGSCISSCGTTHWRRQGRHGGGWGL